MPFPEGWEFSQPVGEAVFIEAFAYSLWLLDLPASAIERLHERLGFQKAALHAILGASALRADLSALHGASASRWVDRLDGLPLLSVYVLYLVSGETALETYATTWRKIHPRTTGHILTARGLTPGPYYQDILHALRSAWLDGRVTSYETEEQYLEELLQKI